MVIGNYDTPLIFRHPARLTADLTCSVDLLTRLVAPKDVSAGVTGVGKRAAHSGSAMAHSPNRRFACSRCRRSAGGLPHCLSNNATIARFQADSVAACQARRDKSHPRRTRT